MPPFFRVHFMRLFSLSMTNVFIAKGWLWWSTIYRDGKTIVMFDFVAFRKIQKEYNYCSIIKGYILAKFTSQLWTIHTDHPSSLKKKNRQVLSLISRRREQFSVLKTARPTSIARDLSLWDMLIKWILRTVSSMKSDEISCLLIGHSWKQFSEWKRTFSVFTGKVHFPLSCIALCYWQTFASFNSFPSLPLWMTKMDFSVLTKLL